MDSKPISLRVVKATQLITILSGLIVDTVGAAILMGTVGVKTVVILAIAPNPAALTA